MFWKFACSRRAWRNSKPGCLAPLPWAYPIQFHRVCHSFPKGGPLGAGGASVRPRSARQNHIGKSMKKVPNGLKLHQSTPFDERNRSGYVRTPQHNFTRVIFRPSTAKKTLSYWCFFGPRRCQRASPRTPGHCSARVPLRFAKMETEVGSRATPTGQGF